MPYIVYVTLSILDMFFDLILILILSQFRIIINLFLYLNIEYTHRENLFQRYKGITEEIKIFPLFLFLNDPYSEATTVGSFLCILVESAMHVKAQSHTCYFWHIYVAHHGGTLTYTIIYRSFFLLAVYLGRLHTWFILRQQ